MKFKRNCVVTLMRFSVKELLHAKVKLKLVC